MQTYTQAASIIKAKLKVGFHIVFVFADSVDYRVKLPIVYVYFGANLLGDLHVGIHVLHKIAAIVPSRLEYLLSFLIQHERLREDNSQILIEIVVNVSKSMMDSL